MRVQRRRRPERLIMIILVVILAIIVAVYGTLWAAQRPMHQAQKTAYSLAVSKGKLKTTTAFSQYNGTSSYYVVTGTSSNAGSTVSDIEDQCDCQANDGGRR